MRTSSLCIKNEEETKRNFRKKAIRAD
jgi:hypothetical protein